MGTFNPASTTPASTELLALTASQVNVSSIGDTYTDTPGNTYAETASQTRMTMPAAYARSIIMVLSGHVNANTGTFELWNNTDSAELGGSAPTTTATSEALISQLLSSLDTNSGDAITIRVKNSTAGSTITIDGGGIAEGITSNANTNNITAISNNITGMPSGGWATTASVGTLKTPSTGTITVTLAARISTLTVSSTVTPPTYSLGSVATANAVTTLTPTVKVASQLQLNVTAIGGSNRWGFVFSFDVNADDI